MTKAAQDGIAAGLGEMEDTVPLLTGTDRRDYCELMQRLSTLAGNPHNLEAIREESRLDMIAQGAGWPAPTADSLARPVVNQ